MNILFGIFSSLSVFHVIILITKPTLQSYNGWQSEKHHVHLCDMMGHILLGHTKWTKGEDRVGVSMRGLFQ